MSIYVWAAGLVFSALVCVVVYYKFTARGRRNSGDMEALVMIAMGLLNLLTVGTVTADHSHGWTRWFLAGSGGFALAYGAYLMLRERSRGRLDSHRDG